MTEPVLLPPRVLVERLAALAQGHARVPREQPLTRLDYLTEIIDTAEQLRVIVIEHARAAGESWTEIGRAMGTTKQGAHKRYGRPAARDPAGTPSDDVELPL